MLLCQMVTYKIKDLETLTGIKAHTIRMWEKRYNLLTPKRTATQIRSYTEEDLYKLLQVSVLYNNGYKISAIAGISTEGRNELVNKISLTEHCCNTDISLLLESTLQMKCENFNQTLNQVLENKGVEDAFTDCIGAFLSKIDSLWRIKKVTPAQKHFVYNLIRQKLIVETERLFTKKEAGFDFLLFTPEGEHNEISLLYYNYQLMKRGFNTLYLGVNLPVKNLKKTIKEVQPKSVVTAIIDPMNEDSYKKHIDKLSKESNVPVYIGGTLVEQFGLLNYKNIKNFQELIK